ncbi:prepilin peptidase [Devosia sp. J2-20]|uniref:A24 family peptidase n=1 Tax=Devosia sp. J2-20 TaxID=3026161 RepID=UPI00249A29C7|nr:prepilin peptidase [Devosia sp. J2-20]WDR00649.1 prepilin peptidase [Devosia sp. J2-20]
MLSTIALLLFPTGMALAASSDVLTMKISNKLVLAITAAFFIIALAVQLPLQLLGMHVMCALAVLCGGFALFALGWIGGGDAKLAAATALWLGFCADCPLSCLFGAVWRGAHLDDSRTASLAAHANLHSLCLARTSS